MATTTSSTSSSAMFSGLASGIDSASLISSLVSIAKIPITQLQQKQSVNASISTKYKNIQSQLSALQTAAKALDTRTETLVNKASSSNEAAVKVSATGGSALGTYSVVVTSVAQAQRSYSDPQTATDQTGVFGTGNLTIQVGSGTAATIAVDNTDTLTTVAAKINASGLGVAAGVMYDGTSYRLQVAASATGASNAITFTEDPSLTLGLSNAANTVQHASDAVLTLDGFTVHSATNNISNAVPGVSLTITGTGTSNVQLSRDPDGLKTKLDAFVTAYNAISSTMNGEFTTVAGIAKSADSLSGDSSLRSIQSQLRNVLSQSWSSLSAAYPTLSSTGLTLDRDNKLSVDTTKLAAAVNADYEGVASLFVGNGSQKGLMGQVSDLVNQLTGANGTVANRLSSLATQNKDIDKSISRMQDRIDAYQTMLTNQFASLEATVSGLQVQGNALVSTLSKM